MARWGIGCHDQMKRREFTSPIAGPAGARTDQPPIPDSAAKGRTSMRALLRLSLAIMALAALAPAVLSQPAFPTHPIRLIVPYPAGGATDVVARIVAEKMSEELGQQIYVDN